MNNIINFNDISSYNKLNDDKKLETKDIEITDIINMNDNNLKSNENL